MIFNITFNTNIMKCNHVAQQSELEIEYIYKQSSFTFPITSNFRQTAIRVIQSYFPPIYLYLLMVKIGNKQLFILLSCQKISMVPENQTNKK